MSQDWVNDIQRLHDKMDVTDWLVKNRDDKEKMMKLLKFRLDFLREELVETEIAYGDGDAEEIVDGLIDLCVVAIGTLDLMDVDAYDAWDEILKANMTKKPGIKPERPNPLGLPDLIKPEGWVAPSHRNNHGNLTHIFSVDLEDDAQTD